MEAEREAAFDVEVDIVVGVDAEVEVGREDADVELDTLLEDEEPEDDSTEEEGSLAGNDIDEDDVEAGDGGMLRDGDVAVDDFDIGEEDVEDKDLVEVALDELVDAEKAGLISAAASQMKAVLPCIFARNTRGGYI